MRPGRRNPRNAAQPLLSIISEGFKIAVPQFGNSAQRLSASKIAAPAHHAGRHTSPAEVLNAFRHQRLLHRPDRAGLLPRLGVLNAFRHQREFHTRAPCSPPARPFCAQRLSASKRVALRKLLTVTLLGGACSTPFGIKDCCTTRALVILDIDVVVLNAFRHQRESRSTRVTICFLKTNIPVCHALPRIWYMAPSHYTAQPKKC